MLGEKRSQSLFAPKASAEKAAATHITTGPDGRKKELPLYFGPDCPVSGNMGQNQHEAGVGEPSPRMSRCVTPQLMMGQGLKLIPQIA